MAYATRAELENALGASVVIAIFDDDNDGVANDAPVNQLLAEASSFVDTYLEQIYTVPVVASDGSTPPIVKFLTLNVAAGLAYERHPEIVRESGKIRMDRATSMLEKLRRGEIGIDSELMPAPKNETAYARSGDPQSPDAPRKVFLDDMGDW